VNHPCKRAKIEMDTFLLVSVCVLLAGCAAEQARGVPLYDLYCDDDDDCEVITEDREAKCDAVARPYAVSKTAAKDLVCALDIMPNCIHEGRDWAAVCSDHICKIRSSRWLGSPRRRCSR